MKRLHAVLVGTVVLSASLPAFAGPDWQAIEQARRNKHSQLGQPRAPGLETDCAAKRLVLPLDHGPRAQTTPYLNMLRKERFQAEIDTCKNRAAKAIVQ